jgi:hypothetical protein
MRLLKRDPHLNAVKTNYQKTKKGVAILTTPWPKTVCPKILK